MTLSSAGNNAMILPLPVAAGAGEDAVEFFDLSDYEDFFEDLEKCFPEAPVQALGLQSFGASSHLKVHSVGSFDASYVPSMADFARLDPCFRLSDDVWQALPDYTGFGFAVFKLRKGEQRVHPMAFSFPIREPGRVFYPTVHVHDGAAHEFCAFDHALYYQGGTPESLVTEVEAVWTEDVSWWQRLVGKKPRVERNRNAMHLHWRKSPKSLSAHVDLERAPFVIDAVVHKASVVGNFRNQDIWVSEQA
jgi:hypothetical protein